MTATVTRKNFAKFLASIKDTKDFNKFVGLCAMLGYEADELLKEGEEILQKEENSVKAFTSAVEALQHLPSTSLLQAMFKKNLFAVYDTNNLKRILYASLPEKDCITFINAYDSKLEYDAVLEDICVAVPELEGVITQFKSDVTGFYAKENKSGISKASISERVVNAFLDVVLKSIPRKEGVIPITNPFESDSKGLIAFNREKFISGYTSATNKTPLKNNALYDYFTVINHADLFNIDNMHNTFCRYLGKVIARLMGESVLNYREIFFIRGGGETGVTTLTRNILKRFEKIAIGLDNALDSFDTHSTSGFVGKYLGIMTECNRRLRLVNHPLIRRITTGDAIQVNPKFRSPFTTTVEMSLLFGSNSYPLINTFKTDEVSRFYIVDTERVPLNKRNADINKLYQEGMDEFLGFCYGLYTAFKEYDNGGTLYKPQEMEELILKNCKSDEAVAIEEYFLAVHRAEDSVYKSLLDVKEDIAKIYKLDGVEIDDTLRRLISLPEGHKWRWKTVGALMLGFDGEKIETLYRIGGGQTVKNRLFEDNPANEQSLAGEKGGGSYELST